MSLTYPPFASSARLALAARNQPPLSPGERGPAVRLLQGGLLARGVALPVSTRNGVPDGAYGPETKEGVRKFQAANNIAPADGIAGERTIGRLDQLLAQSTGPVPPTPLGPPPSPVDRNYEIGTRDPPTGHDPGAGVWNSKPTELSYVALKASIIDVLPHAALVIGIDAARNMAHYLLDNDGTDLTINLEAMVRDVPSARARFEREVAQLQAFVETLPPGSRNSITSKACEVGYNRQGENRNWFFAIGGYSSWGKGIATVTTDADKTPLYDVDFEYKFYDRYNWDAGKSVTFAGITVTDKFMGEFHRQGLAREYDCFGAFKRHFTWRRGQAIPPGQLEASAGRGA